MLIGWLSVTASVVIILIFVAFGWYLVWWLYLSQFKFIRELLGSQQETSPSVEELKHARSRTSRKVRRE